MRATSDEQVQRLRERLEEVVTSQALSFGCTASVDWMEDVHPYYPPLVNDPDTAVLAAKVASELLGAHASIADVEPTMAGEDFAFVARQVPSAFAFLGIRNETAGSVHGLHTAQYVMDETALPIGSALHTAFALRVLEQEALTGPTAQSRDEL